MPYTVDDLIGRTSRMETPDVDTQERRPVQTQGTTQSFPWLKVLGGAMLGPWGAHAAVESSRDNRPFLPVLSEKLKSYGKFAWDVASDTTRTVMGNIGGAARAKAVTGSKTSLPEIGISSLAGPVGLSWLIGSEKIKQESSPSRELAASVNRKLDEQIASEKNPEQRAKLLKIKQGAIERRPDAFKEVDTLNKTNKQVVGDFIKFGADFATIGQSPGVLKGVTGLGRGLLAGAGTGFAYGAAGAMQENKDTGDILKEGGIGSLIGGGIGLGASYLGKLGTKTGTKGQKLVQETSEAITPEQKVSQQIIPGYAKPTETVPITRQETKKLAKTMREIFGELPEGTKERGLVSTLKTKPPELPAGWTQEQKDGYMKLYDEALKINKSQATYNKLTNKGTVARVDKLIEGNEQAAWDLAMSAQGADSAYAARKLGAKLTARGDTSAAQELYVNAIQAATEKGQYNQALSIVPKLSPDGIGIYAMREAQRAGVDVPTEKLKSFYDQALQISKMANSEEKFIAQAQLMADVQDLVPTPAWKKAVGVWKAMLLTGLRTTERNVFSNAVNYVAEGISKLPATMFDALISLKTGKRSVTPTVTGLGEGLAEGGRYFRKYMQTGVDLTGVATGAAEMKSMNLGKNWFSKGASGVLKFVTGQDIPFRQSIFRNSLYEQAKVAAINAGKKGDDIVPFVNKILANPTEDMVEQAMKEGAGAVFQQENIISRTGQAIKRAASKNPVTGVISEVALPFVTTPGGVASRMADYSPLGFAKVLAKASAKNITQREAAMALGRATTGTGLMALGAGLAANGRIALDYPTDARERSQWDAEGKKAYSIKIGDRWYSLNSLGPQAAMLMVGGYLKKGGVLKAIQGAGKTLKEQTFVKGMSSIIDAFSKTDGTSDDFMKRWVSSTIGSTVPSIIADVARGTDKYQRSQGDDILGGFKSRVPGLRETLPIKTDVFGEELKGEGFIRSMLDVFVSSAERKSEVKNELGRLDRYPSALDRKFEWNGEKKELSNDEYTELSKIAGQKMASGLSKLMSTPKWKNLNDEKRVKEIDNVYKNAREDAKEEFFGSKKRKKGDLKKSGQTFNPITKLWQ